MGGKSHKNSSAPSTEKRLFWLKTALSLVFLIIVIPLLAQLRFFIMLAHDQAALLFSVPSALVMVGLGYGYAVNFELKATFMGRYGWFIGAIIYILLVWCIAMFIGNNDYLNEHFQTIVLLGLIPFIGLGLAAALSGDYHLLLFVSLAAYLLVMVGYALGTWRKKSFKVEAKGLFLTCTVILVLSGIASCQIYKRNEWMISSVESKIEGISENDDLHTYVPFYEYATGHTALREESTLKIESDFPRIDGATALFPIYASAVQAIYKTPKTEEERRAIQNNVVSTRTPSAYENLINCKVDLIFAAAPSAKQIEAAQERGLEFRLTPVGKEAFVFIVNQNNLITSLTIEQIRGIYSGTINQWSEVGSSSKAEIRAFQRPEGSGSQSAMLKQVMKELPLREPLKEEFFQGMGGMLVGVANYRNAENALGYSFRFYATQMKSVDGVRLLAIEGIEPTRENIRNGSYPFASNFYMVTIETPERPLSANTEKLMQWFLSEQGQQLIEDVGYVPLSKVTTYSERRE